MKINVGIIGAAGYTAGELLRLLVNHPKVVVAQIQSKSQAGKKVTEIHSDLTGDLDLDFTSEIVSSDLDVVFLCKGHGESEKLLKEHSELMGKKIVDLSQDFRLIGDHDFVYGLPELNRNQITTANHVANPGCFATSIQLGILPALSHQLVEGDIHVSGITGSTGAGQSLSATSHFSWRNNNASVYKPFVHQHLSEIGESIRKMETKWSESIHFIPYRGAFARGIITTSYFSTGASEERLKRIYRECYADHPFTRVVDQNPDLKMVVNTNKCMVYPTVIGGQGVVVSVIDNLLKGASGQALQNMNLMFGLEESFGLKLKATAF